MMYWVMYVYAEGRQPVRDGSRSRKGRLEMKRTSSEGKALDEHPTKDETNYTHTHKAKSHVSFLIWWTNVEHM